LYVAGPSPVFALFNSPACLAPFSRSSYTNYARLVMFSFGFQKAFQRGFEPDDEVFFTKVSNLFEHTESVKINDDWAFSKSLESAKTVVTVLVDHLVPTGYIRFAPDGA
jgi:hypothetical protein